MSPGCQTFGEDGKAVDDYKGKVAKTTSGLECQMWSEQRPHKHRFGDLGEHNFCRNPDGWPEGVWCYTTDKKKRWELCDVPKCDQGGFVLLMMMMAYRHIPTMTDSHHGGFLSVMIMVGICQVTKSHH